MTKAELMAKLSLEWLKARNDSNRNDANFIDEIIADVDRLDELPTLAWTKDRPKEAGLYLWSNPKRPGHAPDVVPVSEVSLPFMGANSIYLDGLWIGPLPSRGVE